ncbi:hybrid sensor histidine kinase/response regulator [Dyella subtropica]|uniref:hybrid sensor histidine kinase/response regulator n=1 Tax=Dyella subtropica TaxID=2992127 RepID=UPI0022507C32|nr:hybrid sensor histidine kinase/response regulator [Dyella subtropica]
MSQTENQRPLSNSLPAQGGHRELASLRSHQRQLLYGGGGLLTLVILLAAIGSCLLGIDDYHTSQRQLFQDGREAIDTFLVRKNHGYTASLYFNNASWVTRQPLLLQNGEPLAKQFAAQGERLTLRANDSAVPFLVLGRGSASLPAARLAAYMGLIYEYSSVLSSTIAAMESTKPLTMYAYEPGGSLFAITGVRDEAQLLSALKVSTREEAFARLTIPDAQWQAAMAGSNGAVLARGGKVSFYFARNPVTGEPSLACAMTLAVDGKIYLRRVAFESADRVKESLPSTSPAAFTIVTRAGDIVVDSGQGETTPAKTQALLRSAGLWSSWPSGEVFRRHGGTYLIADQLEGIDWAIVHTYTWRQMLGDIWQRMALIVAAVLLILAGLWTLLLRMDRRVLAPALADASRVYESEELSRVIIETSPVGLCLLDHVQAQPVLQNDVMRRLAGQVGDSTSLYAQLAEHTRHRDSAYGAPEAIDFQLDLHRPDGDRLHLLVAAAPISHRDRQVWLCALRDVTARAELEERLRQARHDSEQAKRAAEAASHAKSTFVATMSHEIRTPLNGILGHLELLYRSQLEAAQRERLDRIRLSADTLLGIISDVLDFSRIEAGQLDIDPVPFALRPLIEQAVLLFAPSAQRGGLKLYFGIAPALAASYIADAHRIRQILNNLVSNAVKFTESGRISLRASLADTQPDGKPRLRFEVVDSGIGMSEAQLAQLFEPFSQADASISRRFGGSGLGLALCQQLAQLLGGSLSAQSTQGVGSVFTLEVPAESDPEARAVNGSLLAGKRIALLSGAAEWRSEIFALLSAWGADVVVAGQPSDFDQAWRQRADVLLIFGTQPAWSDEDEQALIAGARHVVRALADGPLSPVWHDGTVHISCYSSNALRIAMLQESAAGPLADDVAPMGVQPRGSQTRGRVLLVDDNPVNRELIFQQLEELGFGVDGAEDGGVALRMWNAGLYAAVLTDINMPHMNGYELTRALRERGETLPILAITAMALASEKHRCKEAGIDDMLLKPISLEQLDAAMSRHVAAAAQNEPQPTPVRKPSEKVRRVFVESGTQDVQAMLEAWHRGDETVLLERLHSLKGVLLMLGERDAARACAAMELSIEADGVDGFEGTADELTQMLLAVISRYEEGSPLS